MERASLESTLRDISQAAPGLLDRDRAARLRFEVQSRNEYFDLEPIRRLYRRLPS